jgi:S-adenosylmethionine:tRNA ribosyltransferase-isomerase
MKLSQFEFELPEKLIAQRPIPNRDESRMMVIHKDSGKIEHKEFKDIVNYYDEDDAFMLNNTKVFPARLYGKKEKTGASIEVFLLRELNPKMRLWDVTVDPARKIRVGNKIFFGEDDLLVAEVVDNTTSRGRTIRFIFDGDDDEFRKILNSLGHTPLPKYISRDPEESDAERFQTIFAKEVGAVAAPSAGLHFSREVIKRLQIKGVELAEVTLHTGLASFNDIDVEDLGKFKMDAEYFKVTQEAVDIVNKAKAKRKNICAVGSTVMRAVESSVTANGLLKDASGWTNSFIYPPYEFSIATSMLSNFHLPKSSIMIQVAAFGGYDLVMEAYNEAIKKKYNFLCFGDSMLII